MILVLMGAAPTLPPGVCVCGWVGGWVGVGVGVVLICSRHVIPVALVVIGKSEKSATSNLV